jgi:DNA-binding CsgD family transcriptional regulator
MQPTQADLVTSAYEAALDPTLWTQFLARVSTQFHATAACLFLHDFADGSARSDRPDISIGAIHGFEPAMWQAYIDHYCHHNVWAQNEDVLRPGMAVTSSMLYPDARLMRTEYGNDWLRPQQLFYAMGGITDRLGTVALKVSFVRPQAAGPYDAAAIAAWQALVPHVQRAADLHRRLVEAQRRADDAEETLAMLGTGVLLLDRSGRVRHMNPAARTLLAQRKGLVVDFEGRLHSHGLVDRPALERELFLALHPVRTPGAAALRGRVVELAGPGGKVHVSAVALPLGSVQVRVGSAAVVFVADPDARARALSEQLMTLWRLSPSEAALVEALVGGETLRQYANRRGVALSTVRTQLQSASGKLGVKRQADVVRMVLSSPLIGLQTNPH